MTIEGKNAKLKLGAEEYYMGPEDLPEEFKLDLRARIMRALNNEGIVINDNSISLNLAFQPGTISGITESDKEITVDTPVRIEIVCFGGFVYDKEFKSKDGSSIGKITMAVAQDGEEDDD